jgi:hypothetical protein
MVLSSCRMSSATSHSRSCVALSSSFGMPATSRITLSKASGCPTAVSADVTALGMLAAKAVTVLVPSAEADLQPFIARVPPWNLQVDGEVGPLDEVSRGPHDQCLPAGRLR